jgi:HAD superfamily hydrolase (TIGR01509 family)
MTIRAVIFDRDGVLTEFDQIAAYRFFSPLLPIPLQSLNEYYFQWGDLAGHPTSMEEEAAFWDGFWDYLAEALNLPEETYSMLRSIEYTDFMFPFPEARPALEAVREQGVKIGVLSNFSLASLDQSLERVGLRDLVDATCAATVIGVSKPEPMAYYKMTAALDVFPEECLFFDDELPNVEGARAVGIQAYWVKRKQKSHDLAKDVVCDLSIVSTLIEELARPAVAA